MSKARLGAFTQIALAVVAGTIPATAQVSAVIDIDTSAKTPVRPGFSGFNDEVSTPVEYYDFRFNALAAQLIPGWVRFPGGISSDTYDWKTGQENPPWVAQFAKASGTPPAIATLLQNMQLYLAGKGGGKLIDAANRANLLAANIVVSVNAFTDSVPSIAQLASFVKANGIPVAAWELANEPYNFTPGFFQSGADYVAKMKPYRDAIKGADPSAIVAIFYDDAGNPKSAWDASIATYPDKYWDAVTYHHYPPRSQACSQLPSSACFSQWMADENAVLAANSSARIANYLAPMNPPGTRFLVSEFDPSLGSALPPVSLTDGTLYGGIYVAEYTMRMSTVPSVLLVGSHALAASGGVEMSDSHYAQVEAAARSGTPIDTLSLNFGFFLSAQGMGAAILNGALRNASESGKTTITGGLTIPATGFSPIPALYAQSYSDPAGKLSLVITNKSATAHQVRIRVNGSVVAGPFAVHFVTGTDPSLTNSAANPNAVTMQSAGSGNPLAVPPYSVLRADIITPPIATFVNSASFEPGALAPQQLVAAFGNGFADGLIQAQSQPLPTVLGDTTISVTDSAGKVWMAPLFYVSQTEASFLLPAGITPGNATAKVARGGGTVLTGSLMVASVSPGVYAMNANGAGVAAATALLAGASGITAPPVFNCQPNVPLSCLSTPLSLGASSDTLYLVLFGTGIRGARSVQAYIAGQAVPVAYFGAQPTYAGLDQVNISIPRSLAGSGESSLYLIADGIVSNVVSVNIQ